MATLKDLSNKIKQLFQSGTSQIGNTLQNYNNRVNQASQNNRQVQQIQAQRANQQFRGIGNSIGNLPFDQTPQGEQVYFRDLLRPTQPKVRQATAGIIESGFNAIPGAAPALQGALKFTPKLAAAGAGISGGIYAGLQGLKGEKIDPTNLAMAAGLGLVGGVNAKGGPKSILKADKLRATEKLAQDVKTSSQAQTRMREQAQLARETRDIFSPGSVQLINQLKKVAQSKAFREGDVETLRSSGKGKIVEDALDAIREIRPDLQDEAAAIDFALQFPTKSQSTVKRTVLTPEQKTLRVRALQEQESFERDFGRPAGPRSQQSLEKEYLNLFKQETLTPTQLRDKQNAGITPGVNGSVSVEPGKATKFKILKNQISAQERAAKAEYDAWKKQVFKQAETQTPAAQATSIGNMVGNVTSSPLSKSPESLKDISGFSSGFRDVYRNFKKVYGDKFVDAKRLVLDPFDQGKKRFIEEQNAWAENLDKNIVQNLGIKKGSKESAAVQTWGEGKKTQGEYLDLTAQFGKEKADKIVDADKWFRGAYDQLLDEVNQVRARIYPNQPDKIIPKRNDYYRHFKEMSEGFQGLLNIFDTPANISSSLAGVSEFAKPKSKFLSFTQKRLGFKTDIDAVGGFLEYIKASSYAKHIDPHTGRFRALADELAQATAEGPEAGKLNNFIEFLQDFSNDLSGKTNPLDRTVQKWVPGSRKTFRALNWLNNRVKTNTIIGNLGSTVAQVFNVPQGIASAGPVNATKGVGRALAGMFNPNNPANQSGFLKERYFNAYDKFDTGMLQDAKKFAVWFTQIGDEMGTKYIWQSHYAKALSEGVQNPVKYADDVTRSLVAGRGVGEVPLAQKAVSFKIAAPFQLEVANLWWVMKDMVDQKAFGKIATLFIMNYLFNRGAEQLRGSAVTFDPIQATIDALGELDEEGGGYASAGGRLAGEVLSNVPLGQTVAGAYPEYGATIGDMQLPTRKELFGRGDPTRFGSGLLATKALSDPLYKILPPFGGGQLKKTVEGLGTFNKGYSETKAGKVRFPIDQSTGNFLKSAAFGQYATPEARDYFKSETKPLGDKQAQVFKAAGDKKSVYADILSVRKVNAQEDKARDMVKASGDTQEANNKLIYFDKDSGDVKSIPLDRKIPELKLSGVAELDKAAKSKYNSAVNARIKDIQTLYELGKIDINQAETMLSELKKRTDKDGMSKRGKKGKKITIKTTKISTPKVTIRKSRASAPKLKLKKAPSFKVSKSKKPKKLSIKLTSGKVEAVKPRPFRNTLTG